MLKTSSNTKSFFNEVTFSMGKSLCRTLYVLALRPCSLGPSYRLQTSTCPVQTTVQISICMCYLRPCSVAWAGMSRTVPTACSPSMYVLSPRPCSIVRAGVIQNQIVLPTTAPVADQRQAIWSRIAEMIATAARCHVNVLCLQEAWSESGASKFCPRLGVGGL